MVFFQGVPETNVAALGGSEPGLSLLMTIMVRQQRRGG